MTAINQPNLTNCSLAMHEGENQTTSSGEDDAETFSRAEYAAYVLSQPCYIIALVLGTAAIVANGSCLLAVLRQAGPAARRRGAGAVSSSGGSGACMTSHLRIITSLICSDLLVDVSLIGFVLQAALPAPGTGRCTFLVIKALNTTGLNITLLNLMLMAVDHYIAILHPFRLGNLMTARNTSLLVGAVWTLAVLAGFSDFVSPFATKTYYRGEVPFCDIVWFSTYQEEFITFAIVAVCFVCMAFMYLHIFCEVKGMDRRSSITTTTSTRNTTNAKSSAGSATGSSRGRGVGRRTRNRRALITTLLILGTFVVCWLPICVFNVTLIALTRAGWAPSRVTSIMHVLLDAERYLYDLLLLNTLADPVIYVLRIGEIRRGYRRLWREGCCGGRSGGGSAGDMLGDSSRRRSTRSDSCRTRDTDIADLQRRLTTGV